MQQLVKLDANNYASNKRSICGITNEGIKDLRNIEKLIITNNARITKISHMTKLQHVEACNCNLDNSSLSKEMTELEYLDVSDNHKITDVSFLPSLKFLYIDDNCGIDDNGIKNLDLETLTCRYNSKITNINHLINLEGLNVSGNVNIGYDEIRNLKKLKWLDCYENDRIKDSYKQKFKDLHGY